MKQYHLYHFPADIPSISVVYRVVKFSKLGGRGGILETKCQAIT